MHIDSEERGPLHSRLRGSAWLLLVGSLAGCVSESTGARPAEAPAPAAAEAPVPEAPAAEPLAPPTADAPALTDDSLAELPAEGGVEPGGAELAAPETGAPETAAQEKTPPEKATEERAGGEGRSQDAADVPPEPVSAPAPSPTGPTLGEILSGSFHLRYRGRTTGDEHDHELRSVLTLDLADPRTPWIQAHLMARADFDLDGSGGSTFADLDDTWDSDLVAKLYLAYADMALGPSVERSPGTLRVGRQSDPRLPEVLRLDGVTYTTRPLGKKYVQLGLYGGVPVHLYESSSEGDQAYGTWVEGEPWKGGRARLDWMHLEDELVLGEENDDLIALGLWQELSRHWRLEGEFSRLESDPRDLNLRALYQRPETDTQARLSYYSLLETQTVRVNELDPFTEALLDYFPFRQIGLNVSQAVAEHVNVDGGIDMRRVDDSDDVGEFNRDWERYYATATVHDAPVEGLSLSLTADRWDDDQNDTSTLGADASFDQEAWRASVGTYYSLYKYDFLDLSERDDVRTFYVRGTKELSASLRLELGYELENDDLDTYHTLRWGLLWRF